MEVVSIEDLGFYEDYVYDLETDVGTFYASNEEDYNLRCLMTNTDSVYSMFLINKEEFTDDNGHFDEIAFMKRHFEIAQEAADRISKEYKFPVSLTFEKVMMPYLSFRKKRYSFVSWTNYNKPTEVCFKGVSIVRRDFCKYVQNNGLVLYALALESRDLTKEYHDDFIKINYKDPDSGTESTYDVPLTLANSFLDPSVKLSYFTDIKSTRELVVLFARYLIYKLLILNEAPVNELIISNSVSGSYKLNGRNVKWNKGTCKICEGPDTDENEPCRNCKKCNSTSIFIKEKGTRKKCPDCKKNWLFCPKPHVVIASRLKKKDPVNGPGPSSRVEYVYAYKGSNFETRGLKQYEFSYHPTELTDDMKINYLFYFEHQLKTTIDQLLRIILMTDDFFISYADIFTKYYYDLKGQKLMNSSIPGFIIEQLRPKEEKERKKKTKTKDPDEDPDDDLQDDLEIDELEEFMEE
jgi:hypothetical protein